MSQVTIILPVYNEAAMVDRVFQAVHEFARAHTDYQFLFVDDGSIDATPRLLQKHIAAAGLSRIRLHSYQPNGGKGHAIRTGVSLCDGEMVCFTDGDLAYSLDHLPLLVDALKLNDVVIGSRSLVESGQKNIKLSRKLMGWTFNRCVRVLLGLPYRDTQAGLKGFRTAAAREIFARQRLMDFAFDAELIFLARRLHYKVAEVAARVSESHSYKVSTVNLAHDPLKMFLSLWKIRINSLRGMYD